MIKCIQVQGTPAQRLDTYGTLLFLLDVVLAFITIEFVGLFVSSLGSWLTWYAWRRDVDNPISSNR